jgi:hypothetical protein
LDFDNKPIAAIPAELAASTNGYVAAHININYPAGPRAATAMRESEIHLREALAQQKLSSAERAAAEELARKLIGYGRIDVRAATALGLKDIDQCDELYAAALPHGSPERMEACVAYHLLPSQVYAGLLLRHVVVVRGMWALALTQNRAQNRAEALLPHLLLPLPEHARAALVRRAAARTAESIVGALALTQELSVMSPHTIFEFASGAQESPAAAIAR